MILPLFQGFFLLGMAGLFVLADMIIVRKSRLTANDPSWKARNGLGSGLFR